MKTWSYEIRTLGDLYRVKPEHIDTVMANLAKSLKAGHVLGYGDPEKWDHDAIWFEVDDSDDFTFEVVP